MKQSIQFWRAFGITLCTLATTSPTIAQIVPDTTLPVNSNVTPDGNTSIINGGTTTGSNLFHSFEQFSIPTGGAAHFNNAQDIQNIISRVTGSSISNIDGLIRANGTANLFLLNPNGIIFGPNASLNIGGSFLGSTANSLNFADGTQFSATAPQATPLLTVSVPLGLQFGETAGGIRNQSRATNNTLGVFGIISGLHVQPGRTLALVGSGVALEGGVLTAEEGRIELGSVGGSSLVSLAPTEQGWALGYEGVRNFQDIQLSSRYLDAALVFGDNVQVRGRQVRLTGVPLGGFDNLEIGSATSLTVTASELVEVSSGNWLYTGTFNAEAAGDLTITTGKLIVGDRARVFTPYIFRGSGGNLTVRASESVEVSSGSLSTNTSGAGAAGDLTIETGQLIVQDRALVATNTSGAGAAGDLTIETGQLTVQDGALIATNTSGAGNAGDLIIRASDSVEVSEGSGIFVQTNLGATGAGGDLTIETPRLKGTSLAVRNFGQGSVGTLTVITPEPLPNVEAQIVSDETLPINSTVRSDFTTSIIEGGTQVGSNLFHSFAQFSLPTFKTAYFNNGLDIQNIIARVTGSSVSNIDGLLQANGTANLFLLNPNGIIFGPNATLSIGGSFLASTASSMNFADGTQFSANASQTLPLLNVSVPLGLQFRGTAGSIQVQGNGQGPGNSSSLSLFNTTVGLQVQPGKTVALVGGDVRLDGGLLQAPSGRVELGGVTGAGTVGLDFLNDNSNLLLSFPDSVTRANVLLNNADMIADSGFSSAYIDIFTDPGYPSGGSIVIRAQNLDLNRSTLQAQGSSDAREITLDATGLMTVTNSHLFTQNYGTGNSGGINIKTGMLLANNFYISTSTNAEGRAGNVIIDARDTASLVDSYIQSTSYRSRPGDAGDIHIKTGALSLNNSRLFTNAGEGRSGNIIIDARDTVSLTGFLSAIGSETYGSGDSGDIYIKTGSLSLDGSSQLSSSTFGGGNAGDIQINASDSVNVSRSSLDPFNNLFFDFFGGGGLFTTTESRATGQGGDIKITTGALRVSDGLVLSARTSSVSRGGNIIVDANTVEITNGGQLLTTALSSGRAGNITVNATDSVTIAGSNSTASGLFSGVQGDQAANAGDIHVQAGSIRLDNQAIISSDTTAGQGNIFLNSQDLLLRHGSNITTNAEGTATGGNITIDTGVIVALENSDITANALEGSGGRVIINAQGIFGTEFRDAPTPESDITASSNLGPQFSGTVEINTPGIDPSIGLATLPAELVEASRLIATGCSALGENEFIVTGRGGIPPSPSDTLSSDTVWTDLRYRTQQAETRPIFEEAIQPTNSTPEQLVEAQGWVINSKGEVVLTAHAFTVTPHSPWMTPADCHAPETEP